MANTNNLATQEIFGESVRIEVARAKNALKDFAMWYPNIKRNYKELNAQLEACTRKGQAAIIMSNIRRQYM